MDINKAILNFKGADTNEGEKLKELVKEGWDKAGVAADDALFMEAFVYGEQELKRVMNDQPDEKVPDLLDTMIQIELQYLARTGNFPPAQVEPKANEIAGYCRSIAPNKD